MQRVVRVTVTFVITAMVAVVLLTAADAGPTPQAEAQAPGWVLTSFCTPAEAFPAFRSFRVRNPTTATDDVVLRNQSINQQITVAAPPGDSFWLVPAQPGNNTVQLIVDGVQVQVKASNNNVCSVLAGNARCDPATGVTTITWSMRNNDGGPATIIDGGGLTFSPNPVPGQSSATATDTRPPSTSNSTASLTIVVDLGRGVQTRPSATITVGACAPPSVTSFTFSKTPSVTTAEVGQTITYTYAGTNTGNTQLEVLGLADDRLGVLIIDPAVTIVEPGGSLNRTVTYVVRPEDAATTIVNNAVVVVRPIINGTPGEPQTAVATASVVVPDQVIVEPPVPESTLPATTVPATTVPTATAPPATAPPTTTPGATLPATGGSDQRTLVMALVASVLVGAGLVARRVGRAR